LTWFPVSRKKISKKAKHLANPIPAQLFTQADPAGATKY
jgi:hypothetical protein